MIVNQEDIKTESDILSLTNLFDISNKQKSSDEEVGVDIDSVESLYSYGRTVVLSNWQYMVSYFDDRSPNLLPPAVCVRHGSLLTQTKISVKRVMEEAATKKLIYFNNSTVNGLCVSIENCLLDGLQRRAMSLFEESHSMGLLKKISKDCEAALFIINKINTFSDQNTPNSASNNGRFFQENDSTQKSQSSISLPNSITGFFNKSKHLTMKHLWIKLAMVEKKLMPIIEYIMQHHQNFYDDNSIMSSCISASLFLHLIAGPCYLDFSLVKPSEHIWNDPDALELIDRHKIHSINSWPSVPDETIYRSSIPLTKNNKNRPYLKIQNNTSPLRMQESSKTNRTLVNIFNITTSQSSCGGGSGSNSVAKEYVESLHQNIKHVLLYGKNNVLVQPKEDLKEMQGYLSLHLTAGDKLRLNWTPNQLMNCRVSQDSDEVPQPTSPTFLNRQCHDSPQPSSLKILQWDSALSIKLENIVYLHCHNHEDQGGKITLVCQDGVQHPPLHFPPGGHLLQFLTCLENGLLPTGRLDPPLLQINDAEKTFPKRIRRKSNDSSIPSDISEQSKPSITHSFLTNFNRSIRRRKEVLIEEDQTCSSEDGDCENGSNNDFVFKIVYPGKQMSGNSSCESSHGAASISGDSSKEDKNSLAYNNEDFISNNENDNTSSINTLCFVMKQQILSRAFYGWLQHYRNIKTVRTQFFNLVELGTIQSDVPCEASEGLTTVIWNNYKINTDINEKEIYRLIYFGGVDESIRHEIWPRMLGHYLWTNFDTSETDSKTEIKYEKSLSQWKSLEVIIKQRENENVVGNLELNVEKKPAHLMVKQSKITDPQSDENSNQCLDENSRHRNNSIINVSNCDLKPSVGFYSSDNSIDMTTSSNDPDITFKEEDLTCMADNMHRIDKDVDRCDRNHPYFSSQGRHRLKGKGNLKKLRNIMITWVWEHIDVGYVQGMCDLLAPLLVVLDNESLTHSCFTKLMETMIFNFPQMGSSMDDNLSMMALLLQIIDRHLYDHMCPDGEVTSLYVSYRWFLLDFKRELCYSDVFCVWETIWSARHVASNHFNLFLALSLLQYYRDIILDNNMEYTDIIKFYNEMAEKHQVQKLLYIARGLIESIRDILQSR